TNELFDIPSIQTHVNHISRLVMDPERFRADDDEPMSSKGMGLAYTKTTDGRQLRHLTDTDRGRIVRELYDPYHEDLSRKVDSILDACGFCLIIDAHSFPSVPLPHEEKGLAKRPDICLGYEKDHIDPQIVAMTDHFFIGQHLVVNHNTPYTGSIVPTKHYHK